MALPGTRGGHHRSCREARHPRPPEALEEGRDRGRAVPRGSTGSTTRSARTAISDIDYFVVGPRFRARDLPEQLDLHFVAAPALVDRLRSGDDFIAWTLRFGLVAFDRGPLCAAIEVLASEKLWPDVARKEEQARKSLSTAQRMVDSGDELAALEQTRTALTMLARWRLLDAGQFPLARAELPDQLWQLGERDLSGALSRTIHASPSLPELAAALDVARRALPVTEAA